MKTKQVAYAALSAAMIFVITRFVQIPIPLGYINPGNSIILLICLLVSPAYAAAASGIGSALADLTSYPVYTIPTLLIKSAMVPVFFAIVKLKPDKAYMKIAAAAVSAFIPVVGYTATGMLFFGGFTAGLAQLPGLLAEYAGNLAIFIALMKPVEKAKKYIRF